MMAASQRALLLLLIGSLAFPIELFRFSGIGLTATELLFPLLLAVWVSALAKGAARPPRWTDYRAILLYVGLIGAAALMASGGNAVRFAIIFYSGGLAIVVGESSRSLQSFEGPIKAWIAASAAGAMIGVVAALLFLAGIRMEFAIHPYGTLAPGPYPRIDSTFDFPAMLTNYLSIAVIMTLCAAQIGWVSRRTMG